MVALKARKNMVKQTEAFGGMSSMAAINSPNQGHEIEYLIDMIKSL